MKTMKSYVLISIIVSFCLQRVYGQIPQGFELPVDAFEEQQTRKLSDAGQNIYDNPNIVEGPWPECVGWTGIACEDYIRSFVSGGHSRRTRAVLVPSGISEYVKNRVFIQCDKFGNVIQAPQRG